MRNGVEMRILAHGITTSKTDVDKPYPIIRRGCEEACWKEFAAYVRRMGTDWDMLDLDEFWPDSFLVKNLRTLFPGPRYWTKAKAGPESPIVQLDGDWDEFWNGHRKLRKHTRKLERKLGENLVYKITSDPADTEECLNAYIATELISWKAGGLFPIRKSSSFIMISFQSSRPPAASISECCMIAIGLFPSRLPMRSETASILLTVPTIRNTGSFRRAPLTPSG